MDYIALGISGGGTKSAVFATESLLALDHWGMLGRVDAISSVSGGSFAAALYAISCDPGYCDDPDEARVRWREPDVSRRAIENVFWPLVMKRYFIGDLIERGSTHRTSNTVLAEAIDWRILARPDGAYDLRWDNAPFPSIVRTAPDGSERLEFRHLNPRRPNLILNAGNVATDRQFLEEEAGIEPNLRRLRDKANWTHFAFTDYYFETLLHADLSRYPVADAVAASAAFPLIIDYSTLGRFNRRGTHGNAHGIDFVHLTDGGVQDNHGLTEIRLSLEDILGVPSQSRPPAKPDLPRPTRVLILVIDSSLIDLNGVPRNDPHPLGPDTLVSPLRPFNVDQATSITLATNSAQHDERMRAYLREVTRDCPETGTGPGSDDAVCADLMRIGPDQMDGYDSVLVDDQFYDCDTPQVHAQQKLLEPIAEQSKAVGELLRKQRLHCEVMRTLKKAEVRDRLGLGRYHPQCYVEATRTAQTNFKIDEEMGDCLRHAARWAVAMKMTELCLDKRFGINAPPSPARGPYLPPLAGSDCVPPAETLPPLPRECAYTRIMSKRERAEIPRQAAHCACTGHTDPPECVPEELVTAKPITQEG